LIAPSVPYQQPCRDVLPGAALDRIGALPAVMEDPTLIRIEAG
jgi:hypothetical protein